jgi:hypothetical protein
MGESIVTLFPRLAIAGVAVALLATTVPAFANETLTQTTTQTSNNTNTLSQMDENTSKVYGNGFQTASGNIGLNQADGQANMQQNVLYIDGGTDFAFTGNFTQSSSFDVNSDTQGVTGFNRNELYNNAFKDAKGRIGVNQASGNLNKQLNAAVIGDQSGTTLAITLTQNIQHALNNSTEANNYNFILGNAFQNASGDIGVNQAAGNLNQQMNQLVVATDASLVSSSQSLHQGQSFNTYNSWKKNTSFGAFNDSEIYGNAFQNATGNIGVNQAAGNGNQQANSAVVLH